MKAELELSASDGDPLSAERLLGDVREALNFLAEVESTALVVVPVLVLDDDERLGELTARGLRRVGFDAECSTVMRKLRPGEVVVFDLSLSSSLSTEEREMLAASGPIVVTGAVDSASHALAERLGARDYLVKPVDVSDLAAAIRRLSG